MVCHQPALSLSLCPKKPEMELTGHSLKVVFFGVFFALRMATDPFLLYDNCEHAMEEVLNLFLGTSDILPFLTLQELNI